MHCEGTCEQAMLLVLECLYDKSGLSIRSDGNLVFHLDKKSEIANAVTVSFESRNEFEYAFVDKTVDPLIKETA